MKRNSTLTKVAVFSGLLLTTNVFAGTFTSRGNGGGAWTAGATTWNVTGDADLVPDADDDVTILAGDNITWGTTSNFCKSLTISGSLTGSNVGAVTYVSNGNYTINVGGSEAGVGQIGFKGLNKTITAMGTIAPGIRWLFYNSTTIASGSVVTKTNITLSNLFTPTVIVTNRGTFTLNSTAAATAGTTWINAANSSLTLKVTGFMNTRTFNASASPNTVILQYSGGTIPTTVGNAYHNLTLAGTTASTRTLAANMTIGGNLTMNTNNHLNSNNFNLTVGGNWTNAATFTASAGRTVTFNGTTAQTVSNTLGTTTFKNLTISNTSGANPAVQLTSGTYILDETMTLTNGIFSTGGRTFTLTSTATATARIATITGTGAISGNFTINRFISTRDTAWSDMSSPVQSTTFNDWDNELPMISYLSNEPYFEPTQFTYNEPTDTYVPVGSAATVLTPGQGFEVFLTEDGSFNDFQARTINSIGIPNQGDQNLSGLVSAQGNNGWNLVGNPFASSVSWSAIYAASGGASSGLYNYIEIYDCTTHDWEDCTTINEIPSTQGFWVYSDFSTTPSLIIPESAKIPTTIFNFKSTQRIAPYFTLKLGQVGSTARHTFKVTASDQASDGLDRTDIPFHASKSKATPAMYCLIDGKKMNINNFSSLNSSYSLPLITKVNVSGMYTIEAAGFDFVEDYTCVQLEDRLLNQMINLTTNSVYTVRMNSNDTEDRFIVHFSKDENACKSMVADPIAVDFQNQVEVLPSSQGNIINFNLSETTPTTITITNIVGQTIAETVSVDANNQSVNVTLPEGYSGMYLVKVESAKGSVTKKFVRK